MNKLQLTFILFLFGAMTYAQYTKQNGLYFSHDIQLGSYHGHDFNINYIRNSYVIKIGFTGLAVRPKNKPFDYDGGDYGHMFGSLHQPKRRFQNYHIAIGKIFNLHKKGKIRANITLGAGRAWVRNLDHWQPGHNIDISANYTPVYDLHKEVCFYFNPRVEFPLSRYIGLSISPLYIASKHASYIGIGIGHISGVLRNRIKKKKSN